MSQAPDGTPYLTGAAPPTSVPPTEEEVRDAIRFRQAFGLRDSKAWVLAVAANPASVIGLEGFGIPLLPAEYHELVARPANAVAVAPVIESYGRAFADVWGGMFVDQQAGGAVVAQFQGDIEVHRSRLVILLPLGARFEVRQVDWSLEDLQGFADQVEDESAWFETIGAELFDADVGIIENRVRVRFRSRDPKLEASIREHFRNPNWIEFKWMAPAWSGPWGQLVIFVLDKAGRPLNGLTCRYAAEDPLAGWAEGERPTGQDGRCVIDVPAVAYRIEIGAPTGDIDTVIATTRVGVRPGGATLVRIIVDRPEP